MVHLHLPLPDELDSVVVRLVARRLDAPTRAERDAAGAELLRLLADLTAGGSPAWTDRPPPDDPPPPSRVPAQHRPFLDARS